MKYNSRNNLPLKNSKFGNTTYDINEEFSSKDLNLLKTKIYSTQKQIFNNNINPTLAEIEKTLKNKEKKDEGKKTILDHPFILKKQAEKDTINTLNKNKEVTLDTEKNNLSSRNLPKNTLRRNRSQTINSNFSWKNSLKDDIWDIKEEKVEEASFYEKEKFLYKQKLIHVEQMRNKKREDELLTLQEKPYISNNSKKLILALDEAERKPLYQRIYEEREKKLHLVSKLRKHFTEVDKEKQEKMDKKLSKHLSRSYLKEKSKLFNPEEREEKFENWRENVLRWQKNLSHKKKKQYEQKQLELIEKEISYPYTPQINQEFQGYPDKDPFADPKEKELTKQPTYERLYYSHNDLVIRKEKKIKDNTMSFIPQINKVLPPYLKMSSKPSRNLSSYLLQDRSTNKSTITKSASMTNLNVKSEPAIKRCESEKSNDLIMKNNTTMNTLDNKVVFNQNISNIVSSLLLDDEYNNYIDDSRSLLNKTVLSKDKRSLSSLGESSFNHSSSKKTIKQ